MYWLLTKYLINSENYVSSLQIILEKCTQIMKIIFKVHKNVSTKFVKNFRKSFAKYFLQIIF